MVSSELTLEIFRHLTSYGYDLINLPEPPEDGPAVAALVVQKNRVRHLLLVVIVDDEYPYFATSNEQIDQYVLQKQQHAAHTAIITVTGDPWEITYPPLP